MPRCPRALLVTLLLGVLGQLAPARADSFGDDLGARETAVGESGRGASIGSAATSLNPSGLALDRQLAFEGSYGYRDVDGASLVTASACDSTTPVAGCFYYRYVKAEIDDVGERRLHELGSVAARALTPRVLVGLGLRWFDYNSDLTGDEDSDGFAANVGLTVRATDQISLGLVGHNLVAADSTQYPMGFGTGLSVRPAASLGLSFDALWNTDRDEGAGKARYGGGGEHFLRSSDGMSGYPIRAGGVYDAFGETGYITGGVGFASVKVGLDLSARKQVSGDGDELTILAGLRLFGSNAAQGLAGQ
jgi:hypothetical protein